MIKIFVGCAANWEDAESQAVLDYTLHRHTREELSIVWMRLSKNRGSAFYSDGPKGWQTKTWATPFSGFRWALPELCGYKGRAIYMDSDVIVRADIAELWRQPFEEGKVLMGKGGGSWRFCVSMWDCAAAQPYLPPIDSLMKDAGSHRRLCQFFAKHSYLVQSFEGDWNCLDGKGYASIYDERIKALHYTSMNHQPHLPHARRRLECHGLKHWFDGPTGPHFNPEVARLFEEEMAMASLAGYHPENYEVGELFGPYSKRSFA